MAGDKWLSNDDLGWEAWDDPMGGQFLENDVERLCRRCQNFRDNFAEQLAEADRILRHFVPAEVEETQGSLSEGELLFRLSSIEIKVGFNPLLTYGLVHEVENRDLPRKIVDQMRKALRSMKSDFKISTGETVKLLSITTWALQLLEEAVTHLRAYREMLSAKAKKVSERQSDCRNLVRQLDTHDYYNPIDLDLDSIHDVISDWVGTKPKAIVESIGQAAGVQWDSLRIAHVEVVLRKDLGNRFLDKRHAIRENLYRMSLGQLCSLAPYNVRKSLRGSESVRKDAIVDYLSTPKLTFHGTKSSQVGSIVQHGFLKPGDRHPKTGRPLQIRCGSTFGQGIYSSPDASFSLAYAHMDAVETSVTEIPGLKIIVCATLMGRAATVRWEENWRDQSEPYEGADSHVSQNQLEYIVFDSAQILPCYVVHLDWGADTERLVAMVKERAEMAKYDDNRGRSHRIVGMDREVEAGFFPGDRQRLKQEKLAQARKFFAYGFGPIKGNRIVIEDIAPVDDDEEEYGDYQKMRIDAEGGNEQSVWQWGTLAGQTSRDMYVAERKAKGRSSAPKAASGGAV
jgi:Poly(ADP-ribose) polymerase catalytic domain